MAQNETDNPGDPAQPEVQAQGEAAEAAPDYADKNLSEAWRDDSDSDPLSDDGLTASEGAPDEGEAEETAEGESVSEGEEEPVTPAPAQPTLPEGFSSHEELIAAARRAQAYEKQLSQQAARPAQPQEAPVWNPPHADNPAVARAVGLLRRAQAGDQGAAQAYQALPQDTQSRAQEQAEFFQSKWGAYTADPRLLVEEVVLPSLERTPFAQRLRALEKRAQQQETEVFLQKNASVLKDQKDLAALRELSAVMPEHMAIKHLAMEKRLKALEATSSDVSAKQRQIDASKAAQRGQQSTKGRGGNPKGKAGRIGTTDIREIAKVVTRRMGNPGS